MLGPCPNSPELQGLRSILHLCFEEDNLSFHWFTLNATSTREYQLIPNPTLFPSHPNYGSSTLVVGSKIFFIGGFREPSSDLWILDTRSGNMTQGPSMSVPREKSKLAVGVFSLLSLGGMGSCGSIRSSAMAEHDGKLALLYPCYKLENDLTFTRSFQCELVSLHRAGDRICGTSNWFGVVLQLDRNDGVISGVDQSSLHLCFQKDDDHHSSFHWFTLSETSTTTTEYGLVPNPTPFPPHKYGSSTVTLGSKIFFIGGGSSEPSSDLWILDTRSGNMTKGPSMSVPREKGEAAVGVIDGKVYVIGGRTFLDGRFHEVEVFDVKSETWELAGLENVRKISQRSASVEGKVYMVEYKKTSVYNPRGGEGKRLVQMVNHRLSEGGRKDRLKDMAHRVCVVEDVLFAFFNRTGLMWFDTKLYVWRRLVGRDGKELPFILYAGAIGGIRGKACGFVYDG
ncbi:unnamed protein product [Brassica rapa subsp. narinosa]